MYQKKLKRTLDHALFHIQSWVWLWKLFDNACESKEKNYLQLSRYLRQLKRETDCQVQQGLHQSTNIIYIFKLLAYFLPERNSGCQESDMVHCPFPYIEGWLKWNISDYYIWKIDICRSSYFERWLASRKSSVVRYEIMSFQSLSFS